MPRGVLPGSCGSCIRLFSETHCGCWVEKGMGEGADWKLDGVQVFGGGDMMAWIWMEAVGWGDSEPQGGLSRRAEARTASSH